MPNRLPLALRAWSTTRRLGRFRGQAKLAVTVGRRALRAGEAYRTPDGLVLQVDPSDDYQVLMALGLWERASVEVITGLVRPGDVTIDAGAHFGYLALHAARATGPGGEVHAFEIDPRLLAPLRRHVELNGVPWLRVVDQALTDVEGELRLRMPAQRGWATVRDDWLFSDSPTVPVRSTTLDAYVRNADIEPARISLIKVDVEGSEPELLQGARETLVSTDAAVLVEVFAERLDATGHSLAELDEEMARHGYERRSIRAGRRLRLDAPADASADPRGDVIYLKRSARARATRPPAARRILPG